MKKKYFIVAFTILLATFSLKAQYNQQLYKKLTKEMTAAKSNHQKIAAMLALGDYHVEQSYMNGYQKSMDTAMTLAKKSEKLSQIIKSQKELASTYLLYSKAYNYQSDYAKSFEFSNKAIAIARNLRDNTLLFEGNRTKFFAQRYVDAGITYDSITKNNLEIALSTKNKMIIGKAYEDCGLSLMYHGGEKNKEAIYFYEKALFYYKQAGKKNLQYVYSQMAGLYSHFSEQEKALRCLTNALTFAKKYNDRSYDMITVYTYGGVTYSITHNDEKEAACYRKAYEISKLYIDPDIILVTGLDLWGSLMKSDKKDEAEIIFKEIEQNYTSAALYLQANALSEFIIQYIQRREYDKVENYVKQLIPKLPQANDNAKTITLTATALARYYYYKKQYALSQKYVNILKEKADTKNRKHNYYLMQFDLDSIQHNYHSALKNYQMSAIYRDSMFNETKHKQLAELEIQYNVEKSRKDNLLLKQKAQLQSAVLSRATTQKNLSLIGVALLIIAVILIYRRYRINQRIRKETNLKNELLENLLNEKEWLLKEIHHRVKNNLQIVMSLLNTQSHFLEDETAKAAIKNSQDRIHSMSLIHKKLYQSENVVSINMELYIKELIEYFKITFDTGQRIKFIIDVEPIEMTSTQAVPLGLIINETIINSIKHAFPAGREGNIKISLKELESNKILLTVNDNGTGIKDIDNLSESSSLGIKLIKGFSKELNAELEFGNNNGFIVSLFFNKIVYDNITLNKVSA